MVLNLGAKTRQGRIPCSKSLLFLLIKVAPPFSSKSRSSPPFTWTKEAGAYPLERR